MPLFVAFSEQCEAKLVHVVLLLYLAVSSALECYLLVAAKLHLASSHLYRRARPLELRTFLAMITVDHFQFVTMQATSASRASKLYCIKAKVSFMWCSFSASTEAGISTRGAFILILIILFSQYTVSSAHKRFLSVGIQSGRQSRGAWNGRK